jgi:ribosomal-protein-alanine N-acetyltransferase
MPGLTFVPVTASMTAELTALHADSFGEERWSAAQIGGSLALETTRGWTASEQGETRGFILCQAIPGEIEILTLCVAPGARRRGIGESLLRHMIGECAQGAVLVHLEVAADNEAARGMYEKLGFAPAHSRAGYYKRGAGAVDAVTYELAL